MIVKNRKVLTGSDLVSDGRILTGRQAKTKSIDDIGTEKDALDWLKKRLVLIRKSK